MRLLVFSDLHLDTPFEWAPPRVGRRRRQGLRDTLVRIVQLAAQLDVAALLCGGDLYEDDRCSPDTAEFLRHTLAQLAPLPVYIAPGNHDWYGPDSLYARTRWSPNVHVFTGDRLQPVTLTAGLTLWGAAHRTPANTDGFLTEFAVDRGGVHLALFHGSERSWLSEQNGTKIPHAPFDAEQIERAGLHHAFLGHYHRPRDAPRYTYPGNPEPLAFGEDGDRGVVVATVSPDGSVARERRAVRSGQLHDIELDIGGCRCLQDVRAAVATALQGRSGSARITLIGELQPELDLHIESLPDAAEWMEAVVIRTGEVRPGYDLAALAQEATVRGQFVRDVNDAQLDAEVRRRVLITGLRALDGRDDLEVP